MSKVIVKKTDGSIAILMPTEEATPELLGRDANRVEGYVSHRMVDDNEILVDRYFRNAWMDEGQSIKVDMAKARPIHMNHLRQLRAKKLPILDEEYLRADEENNGQEKQRIALLKKQLRDIPQTYDLSSASTPEELKAMIPEILQ